MLDGQSRIGARTRWPDLRFSDSDLEKQFREDFNRSALPFVRIGCVYGIVGYGLFEILEYLLVPDHILQVTIVRIALFWPLFIGIWLASYRPWFSRYQQAVQSGSLVLQAMGACALQILAPLPTTYSALGLCVVIAAWSALNRVLFVVAAATIAVALALYEGTIIALGYNADIVVYNNFFLIGVTISALIVTFAMEVLRRREFMNERALEAERALSDSLLRNMLPEEIAERLRKGPGVIAEDADEVSVVFADVVGFTPWSASVPARDVVTFLNRLFEKFDELCERFDVEKIKTIGDAYMVVVGLPRANPDHAIVAAEFSLELMQIVKRLDDDSTQGRQLRIGISSGPVIAGVIGKRKYAYDVWGDTVNTASRMESHGVPGKIQVSAETLPLLAGKFRLSPEHDVEVKGKGKLRAAFLLGSSPIVAE
jgi:class 3 adenylate cyclase